ncbi:exonuclease domain-containing protein [Polymorphospora lycopeni]|uniref:Exonuclease domain-containing protein n=1 Tax=Polymorphospora lycopeni TaxID=3140240 RepID=A0ABV5CL77_9ACTN
MSWHLSNLSAFDVESSGVSVDDDRIVSATVAHVRPGEQTEVASHLIAVDVDIPAQAAEVHGITTEYARANGKPAAEVLELVAAHLTELQANGIPVIAMNASFDLTMLDRELRRHGLPTLEARLGRPVGPIVDVLLIDKHIDRFRKGSRRLVDMAAHYAVKLDDAHNATEDALAAARIAYRLAQRGALALAHPEQVAEMYRDRRYPMELVRNFQAFGRLSLVELHAAQVGWAAEQAEGLARFWLRQANDLQHQAERASDDAERETALADAEELRQRADGVSTEWPVRSFGGAR